jgi:hypothetical protein
MRIEILQTGIHLTNYLNSSDRKLPDYDLPSLIATMKRNISWGKGELNTLILLKNPDEQIILAAMHEGTEIESFQSNDSVSFQIIEGKLKFHIRKDSFTLEKDQLMTFKEHIKYRLTSEEETIFLLTVSDIIAEATNN